MKRTGGGKDKGGGKRSKKQYYQGKKGGGGGGGGSGGGGGFERKQFEAKDGFKGVLVTCEGKHKEGQAVREMFNMLNESWRSADLRVGMGVHVAAQYAESMFPDTEAPKADDGSMSIEDALAQEIADIKKETKEGQRKFYVLETNVKGVIFIRFTDPRMQPVPFITHILEDLKETKLQKTKSAVRMLPIEKTCAVQMDKVLELINELARPHFPPNPAPDKRKPFTIAFKRRNNDKVRQMDTIEGATKLLSDVGVLNFRNAEVTILVEIFQRACGVGVIPNGNYDRLEDFNVRRIYEKDLTTATATTATTTTPAKADDEQPTESVEQELAQNEPSAPPPSGGRADERPRADGGADGAGEDSRSAAPQEEQQSPQQQQQGEAKEHAGSQTKEEDDSSSDGPPH